MHLPKADRNFDSEVPSTLNVENYIIVEIAIKERNGGCFSTFSIKIKYHRGRPIIQNIFRSAQQQMYCL